MNSRNLARREFIKNLSRTFGAAGLSAAVGETFLAHILNKAMAAGITEKCYIFMAFPGAPPRWLLDLPTDPTGNNFTAGGFGNFIQGGPDVARSIMRTFPYNNGSKVFHLPPIWNLGRSGNPYTNLLPNITMFRGVDMEIDNHSVSRYRNVAPVIGGLSLHGALADNSKLSLPGIGDGSSTAKIFKSANNLAPAQFDYRQANPIEVLLRPFKRLPANANLTTADWEAAISQSLTHFDDYAKAAGLRPTALQNAFERSNEMVKSDIYNIADQWAPVFEKYQRAVDEAFSVARIKQIFNQPIKADGTNPFRIDFTDFLSNADLRNMFVAGSGPQNMAKSFAISEIAITQNLTSNVTLELSYPTNYQIGGKTFDIIHDQHRVGSVISTLSTTAFYRAFLNCTGDLVQSLKSSGHFDRSVIHVGAEFNRNPRSDFSGADHGVQGSSAMIISGLIKKYALIGNVKKAGLTGTEYTGTWGLAAPFPVAPRVQRPIHVQDIALTIGRMLGVAPVSENGYILLNPNANWAPVTSEAKNV